MGEREIREKYGGKLIKAINRAIRAEIEGGNEALDKLTDLAAAAKQSRWKTKAGKETPEATAYFKHVREVIGVMDAKVRKTWGLPPDKGLSHFMHAPRRLVLDAQDFAESFLQLIGADRLRHGEGGTFAPGAGHDESDDREQE